MPRLVDLCGRPAPFLNRHRGGVDVGREEVGEGLRGEEGGKTVVELYVIIIKIINNFIKKLIT